MPGVSGWPRAVGFMKQPTAKHKATARVTWRYERTLIGIIERRKTQTAGLAETNPAVTLAEARQARPPTLHPPVPAASRADTHMARVVVAAAAPRAVHVNTRRRCLLAPTEDKGKKNGVRQADAGSVEATDGRTGGEVEQQQAEGPEGRSRSRHGETESLWSVFTELGDHVLTPHAGGSR